MTLRATVESDGQIVNISRGDGTPLLTHRVPRDRRPTFHPIMAPDGVGVLTEDGPAHHPWQHGLYTGFNLVNGFGFWRDEPGDGSFRPALTSPPEAEVSALRWTIETAWIAPDGTKLIHERQSWALTDERETFDLDLQWELHAEQEIEIGQFMAGGLFLRMPYTPERGGEAVNSDGLVNSAAEKQRSRWVSLSMPIEGREDWAGMAIMEHPSNPAFPSTWRVDNELGISPSRCIAGSWTIPAGGADRYRHRIHVFAGRTNSARIEERWSSFAG